MPPPINLRDNIVCTVNTANGNCFEGRLTDRAGLDLLSMFHGFITMQALPSIFLIGVCGCERGGWVRVRESQGGVAGRRIVRMFYSTYE